MLLVFFGFTGFLGLHGQSSGKVMTYLTMGSYKRKGNEMGIQGIARGGSGIFVDVLYFAI